MLIGRLGLSIVLMGVAANLLARLLEKQRWIAWLGLAIVLYVSVEMIVKGWGEVAGFIQWCSASRRINNRRKRVVWWHEFGLNLTGKGLCFFEQKFDRNGSAV